MDGNITITIDTSTLAHSRKRKRANYTIDEELLKDFNKFCEDKKLNRSVLIEKFIHNFLIQNGVREK